MRRQRVASHDGLALHVPGLGVVREHAIQAFEQLARPDRLGEIRREAERREAMDIAVAVHRREHHQARL